MKTYLDKLNEALTYTQRYCILRNGRLKWFTREKISSAEYALAERKQLLLYELENISNFESELRNAKKSILKIKKIIVR